MKTETMRYLRDNIYDLVYYVEEDCLDYFTHKVEQILNNIREMEQEDDN